MKNKNTNPIFYIYIIPLLLIVGIIICAIFTIFYTTTTVDGNGKLITIKYAKDFSANFSEYINDNKVSKEGIKLLNSNKLWLQILDKDGKEVESYNKPLKIPKYYTSYEILSLYKYGIKNYTTFIGKIDNSKNMYIIGFPFKVSKVTTYVDNKRYNSGKIPIIMTIIVTLIMVILLGIIYNIVISRNLQKITTYLNQIASRTYSPTKNKKFLHQIYDGINKLDEDIRSADNLRAENEKIRNEWIANITHDLKTPLSPIKGYAEILTDIDKSFSVENIKKYGYIIEKNTNYLEELINDLKLTYQLKSGMLPIKKERKNISRFLKEIIIDILNNPDFMDRDINFQTSDDNLELEFDLRLLKRALNNIIINAIVHNDLNTKINIVVSQSIKNRINQVISNENKSKIEKELSINKKNKVNRELSCDKNIVIEISDNGKGITEEEVSYLFERYYRGTNTKERPEGTGLGMAIAKQIIELHQGTITVKSKKNIGTSIIIELPIENFN